MKSILIYFFLLFFCSCAIRKLQLPTTAIDLKTGDEIKENSIHLEKGKICYIYSGLYGGQSFAGQLFDRSIFKNVEFSNFFPANGVSVDDLYTGSASRSAKVDTVINNEFITQMALQEALINSPLGIPISIRSTA